MLKVGTAIKIVRQAKGVRLTDLAKSAGVSLPFISLIERGDRQPSLDVLARLAEALGVPLEALIVLLQSGTGSLHTSDRKANRLADSIRKLADAEEALRSALETETPRGGCSDAKS